MHDRKTFRITLQSRDLPEFLGHCHGTDWSATDTGERVMTDDGPDAEAVLLVQLARPVALIPAA